MKSTSIVFGASLLIFIFFFMASASAQLGYNNPKLPRIGALPVVTTNLNNNSVNVNNSNCWQGLCNTNVFVEVAGDTMTGTLVNNQALGTTWHQFQVSGVPVLSFNTLFGVIGIQSLNNQDLYIGNDDVTARMVFLDTGLMAFVGANGIDFYTGIADVVAHVTPGFHSWNFYLPVNSSRDISSTQSLRSQSLNVSGVGNISQIVSQTTNATVVNTNDITLQRYVSNITGRTIIPEIDKVYNLGNASNRWANGHIVNLTTGDLNFANNLMFIERGNDLCLYNQDKSLKFCMNADGSIMQNSTGAKPSCNAANRGKVWLTFGGPGVADKQETCLKNAQDLYNWTSMAAATGVIP